MLQFEGVNVSHVESIIAASPVVEVNKEVGWGPNTFSGVKHALILTRWPREHVVFRRGALGGDERAWGCGLC